MSKLHPIPGFVGYFATRDGDIYSTRQGNNGEHIAGGSPKRLSPGGIGWHGSYKGVMVSPAIGRPFLMKTVHFLIALTFVGPKPFLKAVVRHLDDNKSNNRSSNLAWGTRKQNSEDALKNGKIPLGSKRAFAKLDEVKVAQIKRRLMAGETRAQLGRDYGVTESAIGEIKFNRRWTHVPWPEEEV